MNGRSGTGLGRRLLVGVGVAALVAVLAAVGGTAVAGSIGGTAVGDSIGGAGQRPTGSIGGVSQFGVRVAAARDASAAGGIVLAGFTSQQYPTFFKLSGDARTLTVGAIALNMTCTSGAQFVLEDGFVRVRIHPNGRLHAAFTVPPTAESDGTTFSGADAVTARLNRQNLRLSGVWRLTVNYNFVNGMSDQCDSGPVRFIATG